MGAVEETEDGLSRGRFLRRFGLGAAAAAAGAAAGAGTAAAVSSGGGMRRERLVVDIACIGDTWREISADVKADDAEGRRSSLVEGLIYPAGTIPGDGFRPTADGSIGRWFCWGWTIFGSDRPEPHLIDTHSYIMGTMSQEQQFPEDTLNSQGLQGTFDASQRAFRGISGGTGTYIGASGQVIQTNNGTNTTVLAGTEFQALNWVFDFDLRLPG